MTGRSILARLGDAGPRRRVVSKALPALALLVALVLSACSSEEESVLEDAGKCGNIHFRPAPHVVSAQREVIGGGDRVIEIVVDIPSEDVQSFKDLSKLSDFTPGIPESWVKDYWKGSDLADAAKTGGEAESEHTKGALSGSAGRWIVIRKKDAAETRVYIELAC